MKKTFWIAGLGLMTVVLAVLGLYHVYKPSEKNIILKPVDIKTIPYWSSAGMLDAIKAFQRSCQRFMQQPPDKHVGNHLITLQIKDWYPICERALHTSFDSDASAQHFFEDWFQPMMFVQNKPMTGLFTGYYTPKIEASLTATPRYTVPIYATPQDLVIVSLQQFDKTLPNKRLYGRVQGHRFIPYYSRAEIDQGAIKNKAKVLAYIQHPSDRLFVETQGAAHLILADGRQLNLCYAAQNGLPYTPIGRIMFHRGLISRKNLSMQSIQHYLKNHRKEQDEIIQHNRSFVFFKLLDENEALGTQGTVLTPRVSLSVDPDWVPLGVPLWLVSSAPKHDSEQSEPLRKLMIAQDTGGAIKGAVRGDVFWGEDEKAASIAGRMKHVGKYWLLLPKKQIMTATAKTSG